jgi:hypothetical protein
MEFVCLVICYEVYLILGAMGTARIAVLVIIADALISLPMTSLSVFFAVGQAKSISNIGYPNTVKLLLIPRI